MSGPRRRSRKLDWPLRRVIYVADVSPGGVPIELLECGHQQRARTDHVGVTNAYRRRCRACGLAAGATTKGV